MDSLDIPRYENIVRDEEGRRVWAVPIIVREQKDDDGKEFLELLVRVPFEGFWNNRHAQIRHQNFKDAHELVRPKPSAQVPADSRLAFPALVGGALVPLFGTPSPPSFHGLTPKNDEDNKTGVTIEFFNVRYAVRMEGPRQLVEKAFAHFVTFLNPPTPPRVVKRRTLAASQEGERPKESVDSGPLPTNASLTFVVGCPEDAVLTFVPYAYDKNGKIANLVTSASASAQPMCVVEWKDSPSPTFAEDDADPAVEAEERLDVVTLTEFLEPTVRKMREFAEEITKERGDAGTPAAHCIQGEVSAWLGKACWGRFGKAPAVAFESPSGRLQRPSFFEAKLSYANYESIADALGRLPQVRSGRNTCELVLQILDFSTDSVFGKMTLGVRIDEVGDGNVPTREDLRIYGGEESCMTFFKCRRAELDARVGVKVVKRRAGQEDVCDGVLAFVQDLVRGLQVVCVKPSPASSGPWVPTCQQGPMIQDAYRIPTYLETMRNVGYKFALKTARFKVMERWEDDDFVYELSKNRNVDLEFNRDEFGFVVQGDEESEDVDADAGEETMDEDGPDSGVKDWDAAMMQTQDLDDIDTESDESDNDTFGNEAAGTAREDAKDPFSRDFFLSEPTVLPKMRKRKRKRNKHNPFRPRKRVLRHNQRATKLWDKPPARPRAAQDQHMQTGAAYFQYTMVCKRMGAVMEKVVAGTEEEAGVAKEFVEMAMCVAKQVLEVSREVRRFSRDPQKPDLE